MPVGMMGMVILFQKVCVMGGGNEGKADDKMKLKKINPHVLKRNKVEKLQLPQILPLLISRNACPRFNRDDLPTK